MGLPRPANCSETKSDPGTFEQEQEQLILRDSCISQLRQSQT